MIKTAGPYHQLYTNKDKFIILVTGGRGSGKSYALGTFIERLTFETGVDDAGNIKPHVVLYTRYSMPSAKMSVIPEVQEKIDLDGTGGYFHVTQTDIVNNLTGGRIMFRGIMVSTKNQTAKLKSIQGITTFVCDEAEEFVDEDSYDKLVLSIRQKGIQNRVIIIMNPADTNHFIYRKYIRDTHRLVEYDGVPVQVSTHPNVLHIHTSYLDNKEHLSRQFLDDVLYMKKTDPEKYAHVVMGRWADVAEGAIFKNWSVVDEFPAEAKKVARGLDFGYANDPSACVKCGLVGNDLYIDEQFYARGMLIDDLAAELLKDDTFVYADSADPRLIQELSNKGIIIYPTVKGPGSIIAGIERMLDFDHIYVTRRSYNVQNELRNYVWARDRAGRPMNSPEPHDDHACFVGDTLVETESGEKRISEVVAGDYVLTSDGYRMVTQAHDNGVRMTSVFWIWCGGDGYCLECTPDHMVRTHGGWKSADTLGRGDRIYVRGRRRRVDRVVRYGNAPRNVYDLTVAGCHEYYANGILVHNCDAARYYVLSVVIGQIVKPRKYSPDSLGIF